MKKMPTRNKWSFRRIAAANNIAGIQQSFVLVVEALPFSVGMGGKSFFQWWWAVRVGGCGLVDTSL